MDLSGSVAVLIVLIILILVSLPILFTCVYLLVRTETRFRALLLGNTFQLHNNVSQYPITPSAILYRSDPNDLIGPWLPNYVIPNFHSKIYLEVPTTPSPDYDMPLK